MSMQDDRSRLRNQCRDAYRRLTELLFEEDSIAINFEENRGEYEPEVGTILPRLRDCAAVADVHAVVYEEFVRWFDVATAGPAERYDSIVQRIWSEVVPPLPR